MKALLYLVLGVIVLGMVIGIVFKLIGLVITAGIFVLVALWLWRKISGGRGERPL